jgi:predicted PurR-regulated permease PerM
LRKLHPEKNSKYAQISFYTILTVVIIFILTRIFDHLPAFFGAVGGGLHWLGVILQPLITGFFIAYLLYPLTNLLQRQLKKIPGWNSRKKLTRGLAVIFTVVIAFAVIFILMTLLISTVTQELHAVRLDDFGNFLTGLADTIRSFFETLSKWLESMSIGSENLVKVADKISGWGTSVAQNMGETLLNYVSKIPSFLTGAMFAVIFAIYFQLDGEGLKHYWKRVYRAITNEKIYSATRILIGDADRVFSGYIRGQLMDAVFMAVVVSVALTLIRVPFAILIGILSGIGNLIPYLGPVIAYGSTALVCILEGNVRMLIISIIVVFIIQTIDGNVINPKFLANTTHIHPVLVIVALLIGTKAGGLVGMIFAVPIAALIKVEFERLINYLIRRRKIKIAADDPDAEADRADARRRADRLSDHT